MHVYFSQISIIRKIKDKLKLLIYKKISRSKSKLFINPTDLISESLITEGEYESITNDLIRFKAKKGLNDFFIDIGANIGLTSCAVGNEFKCVYAFEPNPLASNILEVNTKINIDKAKVKIHKIALSSKESVEELNIPKHNWGGAFFKGNTNIYDIKTIIKKDKFKNFREINYLKELIQVRKASDKFKEIFKELNINSLKKGVVKIDVEGHELFIVKELIKIVPKDFKIGVVFESQLKNISEFLNLENAQGSKIKIYRICLENIFENDFKITKIWSLLINGSLKYCLKRVEKNKFDSKNHNYFLNIN